jgi:NDP-sugar pyrophosphorylase family protein
MGGDRPARPAGLYVFDRRAFEFIPAQGFQDIKEALIPRLYEAAEVVQMHIVPGVSVRIHDEESYLRANEWQVQRAAARRPAAERTARMA